MTHFHDCRDQKCSILLRTFSAFAIVFATLRSFDITIAQNRFAYAVMFAGKRDLLTVLVYDARESKAALAERAL